MMSETKRRKIAFRIRLIFFVLIVVAQNLLSQNINDTLYFHGFTWGVNQIMILKEDKSYLIRDRTYCHYELGGGSRISDEHGRFEFLEKKCSVFPKYKRFKHCKDSIIRKCNLPQKELEFKFIQYKNTDFFFSTDEVKIVDQAIHDKKNDLLRIVHQLNKYNTCRQFSNFKTWRNTKILHTDFKIEKDITHLLPEKYQEMVLSKPIEAKVITFEKIERENNVRKSMFDSLYHITFNVGKKDGVVVGLRFYQKDKSLIFVTITEVHSNTSKGYFVPTVYNISFDRDTKSEDGLKIKEFDLKNEYSTFIKDYSKSSFKTKKE